jgi:hypothetical protein
MNHQFQQAGDDERFPRRAEPSIVLNKGRYALGRERRRAIHQREMGADTE